jgi:uncharacterized damage-inducible protein DinB
MPASLADRFRRWFDYEQDVHAKVLKSLDTVPPERRSSPEFCKAVAIFAHIAAGRRIWLHRFGVAPAGPATLFPQAPDPADLPGLLAAVHAAWADYLRTLTDADLDRTFEYQSLDAGRFRNTVGDILTQLFGHSWYHRGQIASLVRAAGGEPAITDFVFWCREPIPPATA